MAFWHTWPGLLISLVLSAGALWVCVRRQRQYALPWTPIWAVFVFVFGIPGLLGYLFHRAWPVREECPACGEPSPHDRGPWEWRGAASGREIRAALDGCV